jgi:hypothetical protein
MTSDINLQLSQQQHKEAYATADICPWLRANTSELILPEPGKPFTSTLSPLAINNNTIIITTTSEAISMEPHNWSPLGTNQQ